MCVCKREGERERERFFLRFRQPHGVRINQDEPHTQNSSVPVCQTNRRSEVKSWLTFEDTSRAAANAIKSKQPLIHIYISLIYNSQKGAAFRKKRRHQNTDEIKAKTLSRAYTTCVSHVQGRESRVMIVLRPSIYFLYDSNRHSDSGFCCVFMSCDFNYYVCVPRAL